MEVGWYIDRNVNQWIALMVGCGRCGRVLGRAGFVSARRRGVHQWWGSISLSTAQRHRRRVTVSAWLRLRRRWTSLHRLDTNTFFFLFLFSFLLFFRVLFLVFVLTLFLSLFLTMIFTVSVFFFFSIDIPLQNVMETIYFIGISYGVFFSLLVLALDSNF